MRPILIAPPAIEPISLADAKAWLRQDANDEDELIQALIVSARMTLEAFTRRFFVTQSWRLVLDAWPRCARDAAIAIPFAPFQRVEAVRLFDSLGAAQLLPASAYRASAAAAGGRLVFEAAPPQPGRAMDGVEIDIVVGHGDRAEDTPEPLRRAILACVAYWSENRGDASANAALPPSVAALASPYRRERLT